ncbi:hypothetical protein TNCV_2472661 [Trichonephila clavipes]|nr:hypothetical protein TNCV_2472661 [Trichonephila clavipes]
MNFRSVLIRLKPTELIKLEIICAMNIIDLMIQILPEHEPHDVPWFESFSYFEPVELASEYMEQKAAKKESCLHPSLMDAICHTQIVRFGVQGLETIWCPKLTTMTRLPQRCWTHVLGRNDRLSIPSSRLVFDLP